MAVSASQSKGLDEMKREDHDRARLAKVPLTLFILAKADHNALVLLVLAAGGSPESGWTTHALSEVGRCETCTVVDFAATLLVPAPNTQRADAIPHLTLYFELIVF